MKLLVFSLSLFLLLPFSVQAQTISQSVSGKILIDVEDRGKAWYVYPPTEQRYFLGTPEDAYQLMRTLGLGISNDNLIKLQQGDRALLDQLKGMILLQVQDRGQAYYVDPESGQLFYLKNGEAAYQIMREKGLGITHYNLLRIPAFFKMETLVDQDVPFVAQAPLGEWYDLRQQEACEEASVLMAIAWAKADTNLTSILARKSIIDMSEWQQREYGSYIDTSADDTASRIIKSYLGFQNYQVLHNIGTDTIKSELLAGNIVIIFTNGKRLNNPYFEAGGPVRHALVIKGYDPLTREFITHEPGTRQGENYRYQERVIADALMDYVSGEYEPVHDLSTAMIVIKKSN